MAIPSKAALLALSLLSADPKNLVYIISGRDAAFLDLHLGHLGRLGFSAEHGGFWKERKPDAPADIDPSSFSNTTNPSSSVDPSLHGTAANGWINFTESLDMSWMKEVEDLFRYYTERTAGSHVEVKKSSVVWHWRESDPEWGAFQCRQCHDLLENNLVRKRPIEGELSAGFSKTLMGF
jgi:trehalose 6-phosphate synthase/phosphatase